MATRLTPVRFLTLSGMLIALSVLGSYIKLGPMSIAFDSAPGFVAALVLGPAAGALVCFLGHMTVATLTVFPLTALFHLCTALAMAGVGALGGLTARRFGPVAAGVAIVLANGMAAPAVLALLPNPMGLGLLGATWLPLTLAAAVNALVAVLVVQGLKRAGARS